MIPTLIIIGIALAWLVKETDFFTVRLESTEYQRAHLAETESKSKLNPTDTPYYWMTPEQKEQHLMICHNRYDCPHKAKCKKSERWTSWKLPAKTIEAFYSTLNLAEGCNIARAYLLKDIAREHKRKPQAYKAIPLQTSFITQERVGSHKQQYGMRGGRRYYQYTNDYKTVYHDCLVPKSWLKAHEHDLDGYEPNIELIANGKTLSVNGDYKHGMIRDFVKSNK